MHAKGKEAARASEYTFAPPAVAAASATTQREPDFIRLPKHGQRCPLTGLSRAYLYDLVKSRTVRGQILRKKNALRGVVLIEWASLKAYLQDAMQAPIPKGRKAAAA